MADAMLDLAPLPCPAATARPTAMSSRVVTAIALATLAAAGCRSVDNAQVDILERELRQQESYIYELEDYLLEYSEKLRACRCEKPDGAPTARGAAGRATPPSPPKRQPLPEPELADDPLPSAASRRPTPAEPEPVDPDAATPDLAEPPIDLDALPGPADEPEPEEIIPSEIDVPELEIGPTSDARPLNEAPHYAAAELDAALAIPSPAGFDEPADDGQALLAAEGVDLTLTDAEAGADEVETQEADALPQLGETPPAVVGEPVKLAVRHVLRGEPTDAGDGPENLFVVVEALDAAGQPVALAEQTSIMILREESPGSLQAIQRWDFTAEECASAWQSSALGSGLHFELPLRGAELPTGPVQIWARTLPAEGEKLLVQLTLDATRAQTLDEALAAVAAEAAPASEPETSAAVEQASAPPPTQWRQSASPIAPLPPGVAVKSGGSGWSPGSGGAAALQQPMEPASPSSSTSSTWQSRQ